MRFKLLVMVAIVAVFSVGFVTSSANAQLPDGIITMIDLTGDTAWYKYDKDFAKNSNPYTSGVPGGQSEINNGKGDNDFYYGSLNAGASIKWIAKKGNVMFIANLGAWNMAGHPNLNSFIEDATSSSSFWNATYTDPNGMFDLLVGQDTLPFATPNFNAPMRWDLGGPYGSFNFFPYQVRINVKGFYLAFVKMNNTFSHLIDSDPVTPGPQVEVEQLNTDTMMPAIAVGYQIGHLVLAPVWLNVGFLYNQYKVDDIRDADADGKTIRAYRAAVGFKYDGIVPKVLDFITHVYYGINGNQLGFNVPGSVTMAANNSLDYTQAAIGSTPIGGDGKIHDTVGYGGHAGIAVKLGIHKLCGGVGFAQEKTKDIDGAKWDKDIEYWGSFWYYMDSNFQIVPSVIYRDHMKDQGGVKQGTEVIYGICWKANA